MPQNRYVMKEKHLRRYTYSRTKIVIGFFLSVLCSIFLGTYFEQYGSRMVHSLVQMVRDTSASTPEPIDVVAEEPAATEGGMDDIRMRLEKL